MTSHDVARKELTVFKDLVKMLQVVHDHVAVFLQDGKRDEQMETAREIIGPQCLPKAEDVAPVELPLVPHKKHAEEEKEVCAVSGL